MENFFNWMMKTIPKEEVVIWFNVHNMKYEKIELYGDIFKSLTFLIFDTYLGGEENNETKILLSNEDRTNHFIWCWNQMVLNFKKENIIISLNGEHKDYFEDFFKETFYYQKENSVKTAIPTFLDEVFDVQKPFSKSDLDLLTELYKLLEKNIE